MRDTRRRFLIEMGAVPLAATVACAQTGNPELLRRTWHARWIKVPGTSDTGYGVYHFRRTVDLASKPGRFVVHVSGDQRYRLFVNGRPVAWGPARGDLFHWRFETVNLAPFLETGKNVIASQVWYFGDMAPEAQVTLQQGFLLEGDGDAERAADTNANWKCLRNAAYKPVELTSGNMRAYYVAGPGDLVNAAAYPWGWERREFDDSRWKAAEVIGVSAGREASDPHSRWMLVPRPIPAMEEKPERLQKLRRVTGIQEPRVFPAQAESIHIPVASHAVLLLDQTYLTTAYPELVVSRGKDAVIRLSYAESLYEPLANGSRGQNKGNRDQVEGKVFFGNHDEFITDGEPGRVFRPLWWRTYRYLQLDIETKGEALTIEDLRATYTGFPFVRRSKFETAAADANREINRILDVGWRTARLCAHETYMDCPYYEQLQYVGDTRVQCLVSLFTAGDSRLMRNAIDQLNDSRQSDGATMSRYPTRLEQYIPDFSLWWIGMLHDYWWYVDDPAFLRRMLPGMRAVLSFFDGYRNDDGSLKWLPWWRYFDWVPSWPNGGNPPQDQDGTSALFDMHLLMAYQWAADLEGAAGLGAMSELYRQRERQLRETVRKLYWDSGRKLFGDTPKHDQFSLHAQTMAVLSETATGADARDLMLRAIDAPEFPAPGLYFQFYVHRALAMVGEGDRYLDRLGPWRDMLAKGLTTFAETVDRPNSSSRSDCHAWSASPNIEFMRNVLGVDSAAPGFAKVSVRPHLGKLPSAAGVVPHPKGDIEVRIERQGARFNASVKLPAGLSGEFEFGGVKRPLVSGANTVAG